MKKILSLLMVIFITLSGSAYADSFGDLKDELQKEQQQTEKQERQQPLAGSLFNELGQQELYKPSYSFQGRVFRVYLFPTVSERITNEIVLVNGSERFFEHEVLEEDGTTYNILKQYGDDGKWAIVTGDFLGYTMVMIENGLTVDDFHFVQQCTSCGGDGGCGQCTNGKCTACSGTGKSGKCLVCNGSGKCDFCDGLGFRGGEILPYLDYITPVRDCHCDNGKCKLCDGSGLSSSNCLRCYGSKVCSTCNGSDTCQKCRGKGVY